MRGYLLIHGLENHRPVGHWMRDLASRLRKQGQYVAYPQLPNPETPVAEQWLEVLNTEIELMHEAGADSMVVIAHSLGCVTWLKFIASQKSILKIERVLLVAPADPKLLTMAPTFQDALDDDLKPLIKSHADEFYILAGDEDPWLPDGVANTFGKPFGVKPIIWQNVGHISVDDGFGSWDGIVYWALDPSNDLLIR
jgi:predicted alpha/beta hydrolase family esterase